MLPLQFSSVSSTACGTLPQEDGTQLTWPACRYWMVPLSGMQAGGVSLPIAARGAILDSSSALSLVTDRDFIVFEVSIQATVFSELAQECCLSLLWLVVRDEASVLLCLARENHTSCNSCHKRHLMMARTSRSLLGARDHTMMSKLVQD